MYTLEAEYDRPIEGMLQDGTLLPLNQSTTRRYCTATILGLAPSEQLTFICTTHKDDTGPTQQLDAPGEAKAKVGGYLRGAMRGRRMTSSLPDGPAGSR